MPDSDGLWYKDAVFYEVYVRGFHDANADGNGDLRGLLEKLDYLRDLGVDCLWLMPIYASPLKDDGYDIADFYKVHPDLGAVEDFEALTRAAHERTLPISIPGFRRRGAIQVLPIAIITSGATPPRSIRRHASSSRTASRLTGAGTSPPAGITGTAFLAINPISIMTIPPSAARCSM